MRQEVIRQEGDGAGGDREGGDGMGGAILDTWEVPQYLSPCCSGHSIMSSHQLLISQGDCFVPAGPKPRPCLSRETSFLPFVPMGETELGAPVLRPDSWPALSYTPSPLCWAQAPPWLLPQSPQDKLPTQELPLPTPKGLPSLTNCSITCRAGRVGP